VDACALALERLDGVGQHQLGGGTEPSSRGLRAFRDVPTFWTLRRGGRQAALAGRGEGGGS
jgi:hypothetical protein